MGRGGDGLGGGIFPLAFGGSGPPRPAKPPPGTWRGEPSLGTILLGAGRGMLGSQEDPQLPAFILLRSGIYFLSPLFVCLAFS